VQAPQAQSAFRRGQWDLIDLQSSPLPELFLDLDMELCTLRRDKIEDRQTQHLLTVLSDGFRERCVAVYVNSEAILDEKGVWQRFQKLLQITSALKLSLAPQGVPPPSCRSGFSQPSVPSFILHSRPVNLFGRTAPRGGSGFLSHNELQ
jgi:hypothetical protein